jgi:hypothetical protein
MEERYFFYFERENQPQEFQDFNAILKQCQEGIWPTLKKIVPIEENAVPILWSESISESELLETFLQHQRMKVSMEMDFETEGDALVVNSLMDFWSKTILVKNSRYAFTDWAGEFDKENQQLHPKFSYVILLKATRKIGNTHFRHKTIVPHSGILSWLHYFSPAGIEAYKLQKLFHNPHLKVTSVGEGHLFQVLDNPLVINTPEAEAKVIAANQWMLEH